MKYLNGNAACLCVQESGRRAHNYIGHNHICHHYTGHKSMGHDDIFAITI